MKRENILIVSSTYARGLPKGCYALEVSYGKIIETSPFSEESCAPVFNWGCMIPAGADVFDSSISVRILKKNSLGNGGSLFGTVAITLCDMVNAPSFPIARNIVSKTTTIGQIDLRAEVYNHDSELLPPVESTVYGLKPMGLLVYVPLCEVEVEGKINRECYAQVKVGNNNDKTEVFSGKDSPAWFTKFFYPAGTFRRDDKIEVTVYKKKTFIPECLGTVSVSIKQILNGCVFTKSIPVLHKSKETGCSIVVVAQVIYPSTYRFVENSQAPNIPVQPATHIPPVAMTPVTMTPVTMAPVAIAPVTMRPASIQIPLQPQRSSYVCPPQPIYGIAPQTRYSVPMPPAQPYSVPATSYTPTARNYSTQPIPVSQGPSAPVLTPVQPTQNFAYVPSQISQPAAYPVQAPRFY